MRNPMDMSDNDMKKFMNGMDSIKFSVMMDSQQMLEFMAKSIEILKEIYDRDIK